MVYRPRSTESTFDSDWQQTVTWAQSQGIGPQSYLPVYQLDLTRLQNGEYPMGRAERNLSILAAHNPNAVTSAPSDNPSPSLSPANVAKNAVSDAGKVATGLIGIFTGSFEKQVWDSAKATYEGIVNPASLEAHPGPGEFGGTIGNWLNDTLLSYLPGAADIGTMLQKDPTLSGSAGLHALEEHPLMSILDIMPGFGGLGERVARGLGMAGVADSIAAGGSGGAGLIRQGAQAIGSMTIGGKPGTTVRGVSKAALTLQDRVENLAARAPGVGPALSGLMDSVQTASAFGANQYVWLMGSYTDNLAQLVKDDPQDAAKVSEALAGKNTTNGDSVQKLMDDPTISPLAKEVVRQSLQIGRFVTEEDVLKGGLAGVYDNSGHLGQWSTTGAHYQKIARALKAMNDARRMAMKRVSDLEPHVARFEMLDGALPHLVDRFDRDVVTGRQALFDDPTFQTYLTQDVKRHDVRFHKAYHVSIKKIDQLRAVLDQGGLVDDFRRQLAQTRDPAIIDNLARSMAERLESWGVKSIDVTEPGARAELVDLYASVKAFSKWAKAYTKAQNDLDHDIRGTEAAQRAHRDQERAFGEAQTRQLKEQQKTERDDLYRRYSDKRAKRMGQVAHRIVAMQNDATSLIASTLGQTEHAAAGLKDAEVNAMVKAEAAKVKEINSRLAAQIKSMRTAALKDVKQYRTEYERDRSRMARKHEYERRQLSKDVNERRVGMDSVVNELADYGRRIDAFHQAVFDNPADIYRDPFVEILKRHLVKLEDTEAVKILTERHLSASAKSEAQRASINNIRTNPGYLAEYTLAHWKEILAQPELDPELREEADAAMKEYREDSMNTIRQLVAQGFKVPYIPSATSLDEALGAHSMTPRFGHGVPKPDIAKEKIWALTPRKEDPAVGLNKAVIQSLQRDANIHLTETILAPMTQKASEVARFINDNLDPAARTELGNHPDRLGTIAARELNLRAFDPYALFGIRLPRWGGEDLYLPAPIVDALEKMENNRRSQLNKLITGSNKVFRYSILGLSPRYDAHVIFGGALMLALRSSPHILEPKLIGEAWRSVRDRTLPVGISHPVEEGFEAPAGLLDRIQPERAIVDTWNRQWGKDQVNMMVGEHIEQRQGISRHAAKPVHAIRAIADLNFRFIRYLRDLQSSMAYFDGVAKYEGRHGGRVEIEDPETGKMIHVSSERAVKEGMHHVEQVYGNLNRMSPFERQVAQSIMPFYGWQKHILSFVLSYPFDHPMRALILSQLAFNASNSVPLAFPIRLQLLMPIGSPDSSGNQNAIDIRSLDPFRDVANYATWTGVFESLNPALDAPLAMAFGSQAVYGESSLYPNVTYNAFYGIQTASSGGDLVTALEQWTPQVGAIQSALQSAQGVRSQWTTDRSGAIKTMLESLNIPFVTPPINLRQLAAKGEAARFEAASKAAYNAFASGDFSGLAGYKTVPNPLNTAYQVTPAQLEEMYNQAKQAQPNVAPIESMLPPPSPYGW